MGASVDELDVDLDAVADGRSPDHRADRVGDPAPAADDPAHVAVGDVDVELQRGAGVVGLDPDAVGVVDHVADEVLEHRGRRRGVRGGLLVGDDLGALVGGLVDVLAPPDVLPEPAVEVVLAVDEGPHHDPAHIALSAEKSGAGYVPLDPELPRERPRYLMGVGKPADIVGAVQRGVDMFDCVLPTRSGRTGQAFTGRSVLNLLNARHRDDPRPLCALAFDHRSQFEQLAAQHGRPFEAIGDFKELIAEVLLEAIEESDSSVRHGAIVDHRYGSKALARLARADIWTGSPVEIPGSRPLEFEPHFATGPHLSTWPAQQVVKCLMFYHPDDDAALRHEQEQKVRALYADIVALDRRLILEVICPATEHAVTPETLPRAMRRLYNLGVRPDWWKLETQSAAGWEALSAVIRKNDPQCKGVVLLGLGADETTLASGLTVAAAYDICRGFAVGRSIFADAARQWFAGEIDGSAAKGAIKQRYLNMIDVWCSASEAMRASA